MGSILEAVGGVNMTRPRPSNAGPLHVGLALTLFQLVGVNQQLNAITMSGSILLNWVDPRFRWDPKDHSGVESVHIPYRKIWTPDIYAYFGLDEERKEERDSFMVKITSNGSNLIELPFRSTSFCGINVHLFPFDRQNCTITFGSWSYESQFMIFHPNLEPDMQNYYDNQEWVLLRTAVNTTLLVTARAGNFSVVLLTIEIARQPFYYIFNLVIPATVVTLTSILGMHAPTPHRTPRTSRFQLGIVTLLPMGVMLLTIVNDLPKFALSIQEGSRGSFSGVPLLGMYYLALLITISVVTTTYSLFVWLDRFAAEGNPIPLVLKPLAPRIEPQLAHTKQRRKTLYHRKGTARSEVSVVEVPNHPNPEIRVALAGRNGSVHSLSSSPDTLADELRAAGEEAEARCWELLIRRLEWISLIFYICLVGVWLLMFFNNDWRNSI